MKLSCVCLLFAYSKDGYPKLTYSCPKVTYSGPKVTYSDPKMTHGDLTHLHRTHFVPISPLVRKIKRLGEWVVATNFNVSSRQRVVLRLPNDLQRPFGDHTLPILA